MYSYMYLHEYLYYALNERIRYMQLNQSYSVLGNAELCQRT